MGLDSIYTQLITENSRSPRHRKIVNRPTFCKEGCNPNCGDDITLSVRIDNDILEDIGFEGNGCAISQASVTMMIDLLKGKPVSEAKKMIDLFLAMITGEKISEEDMDSLEDAQALAGIANMPARVKCAVLAWRTLLEGIESEQ
ncbi:MAG: SUF system NifU family Fe-S cluster assembly protein [Spirochaetales bacterium]